MKSRMTVGDDFLWKVEGFDLKLRFISTSKYEGHNIGTQRRKGQKEESTRCRRIVGRTIKKF